jgi:hypothetical protein
MGRVPASVRNQVAQRDKYRCQECGVRVGRSVSGRLPGLQFHAHHKVPQSQGGKATPNNLVTMCTVCHVTKRSRGHRLLFSLIAKRNLGDFIIWFLRDFGMESLAYSERLDPQNLPSRQIQSVLENVVKTCRGLIEDLRSVSTEGRTFPVPSISDVLPGLKIGWRAYITERHLDRLLQSNPESTSGRK